MCSNFILEIDQKAINFGCVCARLDVLYIFFRYRRAVDLSFQFISWLKPWKNTINQISNEQHIGHVPDVFVYGRMLFGIYLNAKWV